MEAREIILMHCLATHFFPPSKRVFCYPSIFLVFFFNLVNISFMFVLNTLFLQFSRDLMPVEMETISLIAEVNVITLHADLKEPFSSGSLMNNLVFDVS